MNIQKLPMRPVICLLLVVLLISTVFSVAAFADEVFCPYSVLGFPEGFGHTLATMIIPDFNEIVDPFDSKSEFFYWDDPYDSYYIKDLGLLLLPVEYVEIMFSSLNSIYSGVDPDNIRTFDLSSFAFYFSDGVTEYFPVSVSSSGLYLVDSDLQFIRKFNSDSPLLHAVSETTVSSVFDCVLDLLPILFGCIVGYIAIRKGISFLESILYSA